MYFEQRRAKELSNIRIGIHEGVYNDDIITDQMVPLLDMESN